MSISFSCPFKGMSGGGWGGVLGNLKKKLGGGGGVSERISGYRVRFTFLFYRLYRSYLCN